MKKKKVSAFLIFMALGSLLTIGGIVAAGVLKNKPKLPTENLEKILGQSTGESAEPAYNGIKTQVQNTINSTLNSTKEVISEKIIESEKSVMESVNKEVANLTQSQVVSFKTQLCRDLGVLPTITPSPNP